MHPSWIHLKISIKIVLHSWAPENAQLWLAKIRIRLINLRVAIGLPLGPVLAALADALLAGFRSRAALRLEILAPRHQIGVLQRSAKRPRLTPANRFLWAWLCSAWKDWRSGTFIMKPSTVVGWHRLGFRLFWTWKIRRGKPGRPAGAEGGS
jgi:hypothetical protein